MGLLRVLSRRKVTYDFEGRKVLVYYRGLQDKVILGFFLSGIKRVCETLDEAKRFPILEFWLVSAKEKRYEGREGVNGWFDHRDFVKGLFRIYINYPNFEFGTTLGSKMLSSTLTHELTHLWHFQIARFPTLSFKAYQRLEEILDKKVIKSKRGRIFSFIRKEITLFFHRIFIEGIAVYKDQYVHGNILFNKTHFEELYAEAASSAELVEKRWALVRERLRNNPHGDDSISEQEKKELSAFYVAEMRARDKIGLHVIYTLTYFSHNLGMRLRLEDIATSKFFQLIKTYEYCCLNNQLGRYKPVVSYNSKKDREKGILDYDSLLAELGALIREKGDILS